MHMIYLKYHLDEFTKRYETKTVRDVDEVRFPGDPLTDKNFKYSEEEILLGRAWEIFDSIDEQRSLLSYPYEL